jgi:hypothetical protein
MSWSKRKGRRSHTRALWIEWTLKLARKKERKLIIIRYKSTH